MTLRARLGWGLLAIVLVLVIPLLLAIRSLERLHNTSRLLRDREFSASMMLGSFRERTDDTRNAEDALLFVHDPASSIRMEKQLDGLIAFTDSLDRYNLGIPATGIRESIESLRRSTREEYAAASSGSSAAAEEISLRQSRPAIAAVDSTLAAASATLRNRTRIRVEEATDATREAEVLAAGALPVALLIAALIAFWLMRSISGPVSELDRGMQAIADGDMSQQLALSTERHDEFGRLAISYRTMARQLSELERLRAEFVSVASHELKTPINVILGYLELIQEGIYGDVNPKQREILITLTKQTNTLTRLVKRLLDISRFEASGGKLDVRHVNLHRLLQNLESSFSVLALQREIRFTVRHEEPLPETVLWDEDRINEVLGNLLSNAFKFTERCGEVALQVKLAGEKISITVKDTGVGISQEQLPAIFKKFYQADNQAKTAAKGTGLGLAIAKEIVEAHGGRITVNSKAGTGTTFLVELPTEPPMDKRRRDTTPRERESA